MNTPIDRDVHGFDRHSRLVLRNVWIDGRRTSVKLEPELWDALQRIAAREGRTMHDLVSVIDHRRPTGSFTSALRAFVVSYLTTALDGAKTL